MTSELLNQYAEICRDAIKSSSAKLGKTSENLLMEILLLYMAIQMFPQCKAVLWSYELSGKTQEPAVLFLQRIICITECCKSDDENGVPYSMVSFKKLMASTYIAKLFFDKCRNTPNRKLISHNIKELFGWQRKAA